MKTTARAEVKREAWPGVNRPLVSEPSRRGWSRAHSTHTSGSLPGVMKPLLTIIGYRKG
jgi:hypothetical protein